MAYDGPRSKSPGASAQDLQRLCRAEMGYAYLTTRQSEARGIFRSLKASLAGWPRIKSR